MPVERMCCDFTVATTKHKDAITQPINDGKKVEKILRLGSNITYFLSFYVPHDLSQMNGAKNEVHNTGDEKK